MAVMMFLTAADVIMRYFFNSPIPGAMELIQFSMAVFNGAGIAYCAVVKGHVDVEVIVTKLPERIQEIIASITTLFSIGLFVLITLNTYVFMKNIISLNTVSPALAIPVYPFVVIVMIGCGLLTILLIAGFFESLYKAIKK